LKEATLEQTKFMVESGCVQALTAVPLKVVLDVHQKVDSALVINTFEALEKILIFGKNSEGKNHFMDYFYKAATAGVLERIKDAKLYLNNVDSLLVEYLNPERALELRNSGNDDFRNKNFLSALKNYTAALGYLQESHPEKPATLCSRANCFIQLQKYDECLVDCNAALKLNPKYVRALFWRSSVFGALNKVKPALHSAEIALCLEPENKVIYELHKELQKLSVVNKYDCTYCGKSEKDKKNKKCGRCLTIYYCCTKHQQLDWSAHKIICSPLIKTR